MANQDSIVIDVAAMAPGRQGQVSTAAWQRYVSHMADYAKSLKLQELRKGKGVDNKALKPVKPTSRPDGATGPPLSPHRPESRSQKWLRASAGHKGGTVTLWWSHGWGKILGYHARGEVRGAPVRDVIGLTSADGRKLKEEASRWWALQDRITPPSPPNPKVAYLPPGAKPSARSKKIQVYQTPARKPPGAKAPPSSKPVPQPKPRKSVVKRASIVKTPTAPPPVPVPAPVPTPPPLQLPPGVDPQLVQRAVDFAKQQGVDLVVDGRAHLTAAYGSQRVQGVHAAFDSGQNKVFLNLSSDYWKDPATVVQRWTQHGFTSSSHLDHAIHHEVGHALHFRADNAEYRKLRTQTFNAPQQARIRAEVSSYAATNPVEFVAEVFAGLQSGKTYSSVIMKYYDKIKGPKLP